MPSIEVTVPAIDLMNPLCQYARCAVILFFPRKMPSTQDVAQWVNYRLGKQVVQGVFFGARGFYEILLSNASTKNDLLAISPTFYGSQMIHVLPWSLTKDYQSLIQHQCPVWVEVQDFPITWKHLLPAIVVSLGKVICPPKLDANSSVFCGIQISRLLMALC